MIDLDQTPVGTVLRFVNEHPERPEQRPFPTCIVKVHTPPYGHTTGHQMLWVAPIWTTAAEGWYAAATELHPLPEVRLPRRVLCAGYGTEGIDPAGRHTIWRSHWYVDGTDPRGGYVGWIPSTHRAAR